MILAPKLAIKCPPANLTRAPPRTEMVGVAVTVAQVLGEWSLPSLKTKSAALIAVWYPPPARSIMVPLMPRV